MATTYKAGVRPKAPPKLEFERPQLFGLIQRMWQTDFRLRPTMQEVVAALEATPPTSNKRRLMHVPSAPHRPSSAIDEAYASQQREEGGRFGGNSIGAILSAAGASSQG